MSFFSRIKESQIKFFFIISLLGFCFFIAFNNHPLTFGFWETAEIYKNFLPTKKPWMVFSIPEDPVLFGPWNTFGYAGLGLSRYISDFFQYNADCYFINGPFKKNVKFVKFMETVFNTSSKKKILFLFINCPKKTIEELKNIQCIESFYINKIQGYSICHLNNN